MMDGNKNPNAVTKEELIDSCVDALSDRQIIRNATWLYRDWGDERYLWRM